jgi:hypothetical protein
MHRHDRNSDTCDRECNPGKQYRPAHAAARTPSFVPGPGLPARLATRKPRRSVAGVVLQNETLPQFGVHEGELRADRISRR